MFKQAIETLETVTLGLAAYENIRSIKYYNNY